MTPALITGQSAEDRGGHERADKGFRHDNAREQKCTAATEINETCNETAPVVRELFPDQKNQGNQSDHGERTREARCCGVYPKELERGNNEPVEQRRF